MKLTSQSILSSARIVSLGVSKERQVRDRSLIIKDQQGYHIIPFDEIIRCEADGNYTTVHTISGGEIIACKTLKYVESKLPNSDFLRIHQSHLVAISAVRRVDADQFVSLSNSSQIPYSRRSKATLLTALGIK